MQFVYLEASTEDCNKKACFPRPLISHCKNLVVFLNKPSLADSKFHPSKFKGRDKNILKRKDKF